MSPVSDRSFYTFFSRSPNGRPTAADRVAQTLRKELLDGKYPVGERLPTERTLSETFGVSRHIVREALKSLQALGLVRIRQGSGCYVNDVELFGGLELLEDLLVGGEGMPDLKLIEDLVEFRANMACDAMRLAASRRTENDLKELRRILDIRPSDPNDLESMDALSDELLRVLARATQNRVYELAFNSLGRIFAHFRRLIPATLLDETNQPELLDRIYEAIAARDAEMAVLYSERYARVIREILGKYLGLRGLGGEPIIPKSAVDANVKRL